jgi:hypothetical protein
MVKVPGVEEIEMFVSTIINAETEENERKDSKIKLIQKFEEMTDEYYDFLKKYLLKFRRILHKKINFTYVESEINEMESKLNILKNKRRFQTRN